jgi:hypothetical protein
VHGEDDFLHETGVAAHRTGRAGNRFGEDVESDQAAIEQQPERQAAVLLGPARLEDLAEDEGEDRQHQQRAEENPQHAKHRASVAQQHVPFDQLAEKVTVAPDVGNDLKRI